MGRLTVYDKLVFKGDGTFTHLEGLTRAARFLFWARLVSGPRDIPTGSWYCPGLTLEQARIVVMIAAQMCGIGWAGCYGGEETGLTMVHIFERQSWFERRNTMCRPKDSLQYGAMGTCVFTHLRQTRPHGSEVSLGSWTCPKLTRPQLDGIALMISSLLGLGVKEKFNLLVEPKEPPFTRYEFLDEPAHY